MVIRPAEVMLLAVGGGPTLDFADATALLAKLTPPVDAARRRRLN